MAALLTGLMVGSPVSGVAQQSNGNGAFQMDVKVDRVLTNVVVRDKKTGELVKGLKQSDFTIIEDKKPQKLLSVDYQNVDDAVVAAEKTVAGTAPKTKSVADLLNNNFAAAPEELKDHRLWVIFYDLSSMQPEDINRAVDATKDFINNHMQPADLVGMISLSGGLSMDQDFTSDKDLLLKAVAKYDGTDGSGYAAGSEGGGTDATADDSSSFVADDSEFNALNTDRELYAIRDIAKALEHVEQKKSMLYFSGGLTRQGIENEASMRVATNEAVKANMYIYAVDSRGLEALPPVGNASVGSTRGTSAYSGASMQSQLNSNFSSQETLGTLAADTGGKLFTDSNDFAPAFQQVQHDTEAYYILSYHSSNTARDGTYRHLTVKVNSGDYKLEFRPGYYAPADFQHANTEGREQQLTDQMRSDVPAVDVMMYLQALYFRLDDNRFFVPVSLIVPGKYIPFAKAGDKDKATLDVRGQVKNAQGIIVGQASETVKLSVDASQQVQQKNVQYTTGFTLAPGKYHLKFIVRENVKGGMGSFETDLQVPDLKKSPLKLSSIVLSSQLTQNAKKSVSPLVRTDAQGHLVQWELNVPHVFRQDQHMYFLYEVYDPTKQGGAPAAAGAPAPKPQPNAPVKVLTSIEFMSGGVKVFETPLVEADAINVPERSAVAFQFDVPLAKLKPGTYVCQINVIDDAGLSFSFPRLGVIVRPAAAPAAAPAPAATASAASSTM